VATPVPIPNTEVKRLSADDTREATLWENMPLPGGFSKFLEISNSNCNAQYPKYPEALTLQIKRPIIQLNTPREQSIKNKDRYGQQI
jgi:hypothetical protein